MSFWSTLNTLGSSPGSKHSKPDRVMEHQAMRTCRSYSSQGFFEQEPGWLVGLLHQRVWGSTGCQQRQVDHVQRLISWDSSCIEKERRERDQDEKAQTFTIIYSTYVLYLYLSFFTLRNIELKKVGAGVCYWVIYVTYISSLLRRPQISGGPKLERAELRWQFTLSALQQGVGLLGAVPQIYKMCKKPESWSNSPGERVRESGVEWHLLESQLPVAGKNI